MKKHKYKVNQQVLYRHESEEIAQLMIGEFGDLEYRLKSGAVVRESLLKG